MLHSGITVFIIYSAAVEKVQYGIILELGGLYLRDAEASAVHGHRPCNGRFDANKGTPGADQLTFLNSTPECFSI